MNRRSIKDLSKELQTIIYAMCFHKKSVYMEGSASYSIMKYPADIDLYESVKFNYSSTDECIKHIYDKLVAIVDHLNNMFNTYVTEILVGDVKWTVAHLKRNYSKFAEDIQKPFICKIDVLSLIEKVYIELSITYQFYNRGKMINKFELFSSESLKKDIDSFKNSKNYYKMAKRILSLALIDKNKSLIKQLVELFNSDIGKLSQINANIDSLVWLLEHDQYISMSKIENEIDTFIPRLSQVFELEPDTTDKEKYNSLMRRFNKTSERTAYLKLLKDVASFLDSIIQKNCERELHRMNLMHLTGGSIFGEVPDHSFIKRHAVKVQF